MAVNQLGHVVFFGSSMQQWLINELDLHQKPTAFPGWEQSGKSQVPETNISPTIILKRGKHSPDRIICLRNYRRLCTPSLINQGHMVLELVLLSCYGFIHFKSIFIPIMQEICHSNGEIMLLIQNIEKKQCSIELMQNSPQFDAWFELVRCAWPHPFLMIASRSVQDMRTKLRVYRLHPSG